ncbi:MAG TPA: energy transducer TonB [Vicinamibacterales bacterium]|nr:energy transducer TonB [Vicinamibacterales bacterium]
MNRTWTRGAALACAVLTWGSIAAAQESIQQVKALYASAAYEDALSMLSRLQAANRRPEYEQYRVFCLVALGRTVEAEKAIASVVSADPSFVPDPTEASPRIRDMFARTRRALVPEIAQRLYQEARAALDRKDSAAAARQFESLVQLIDSTAIAPDDEPMLSELRLLAAGFLDLTKAVVARAETAKAAEAAAAKPVAEPVQVTAPVPIKQELPAWTPPDPASHREYRGAVRVFISESGGVTAAELSPAVHPVYDRVLLQAARTWQYQPALRNGLPVPSEKVIEVVLKPR